MLPSKSPRTARWCVWSTVGSIIGAMVQSHFLSWLNGLIAVTALTLFSPNS